MAQAQDARSPGEGVSVPKPRLTYLQRALVLRLKAAQPDLSMMAIAQACELSESSVRRILAYQTADVKATTKAIMETAVLERLDDWAKASRLAAKKGYHQPAKDFLEAAGAIDPKATVQANVNVQPTVHLAMNFGLGALANFQPPAAPAIEAETVPVPALPEAKP